MHNFDDLFPFKGLNVEGLKELYEDPRIVRQYTW